MVEGLIDCVPTQVGAVKKGGYCILKGKPCKVSDYSTAKPGKHGSAKATIVGIDIFTGKKYEDGGPTASNIMVPNVVKKEYEIIDINEDGYAVLTLENGDTTEHLKFTEDIADVKATLEAAINNGKECYVSVISAVGQEKIVDGRVKWLLIALNHILKTKLTY